MNNLISNPIECIIKSDPHSDSDSTDLTSAPSDTDSINDESSLTSLLDSQQRGRRKSVRFSLVLTREYNVVDELAPPGNDKDEAVRRSLGWDYTEKESDLETHMKESQEERKEQYLLMIQNHILRAEREKEERENNKPLLKKRGFKSKVLKPLWKGLLDGASRYGSVMPSPYVQN
mmetsp:Transcript_20487/g.31042  ORF Transcript_20487/g.31042 Transcript_20487/m.31042 type:complete len:175 (-) Transcript_20487:190-714(-)